jgi:hypothetical protein
LKPQPVSEIQIAIHDGPNFLEHRHCRTMLLPDGRTGALWRGLVYPLGENQNRHPGRR